jgi:hypothetical protein
MGSRSFHGEPHLQRDLPVRHLIFVDVTAGFDDLKPAEIFDGFARAFERGVNGVLDAFGGRAGEFDVFIDAVFHEAMGVRCWVITLREE